MTILTEDFDKLDGSAPAVKDIGVVTFGVEQLRVSANGMATIVESKVPVQLVGGVLTSPQLDPGPATVRIGTAGRTYRIVIPASGTHRLWPLIQSHLSDKTPAAHVANLGGVTAAKRLTAAEHAALGSNADPTTLYVIT